MNPWLRPPPPTGPLTFITERLKYRIGETTATVGASHHATPPSKPRTSGAPETLGARPDSNGVESAPTQ
jgi:hypothetical protein